MAETTATSRPTLGSGSWSASGTQPTAHDAENGDNTFILRPRASFNRLRLQTSVRLRWYAVAGQLAAVVFVAFGLGFDVPVGWCLLIIAMSAWLNIVLRWQYPRTYRPSAPLATALFAYDIVQLGALLFITGGIDNPFVVLVVAPVTVSAATLPPRNTLLLGGLALAVTLVVAFWHHPLPWSASDAFVLPLIYKLGVFTSVAACLMFLTFYAWRLAREAEQMSTALAATELVLAREQRLHALDGLAAAAAHELGTPLATIVLTAGELERDLKQRLDARGAGDPLSEADADAQVIEDLELVRCQAARCREILQKLTRAPSARDPLHASMSLSQIADEAAEPYRDSGVSLAIRAAADVTGPEPVAERRPGVLFGIGNVIENAVDFATSRVEIESHWDDDRITLTISDDGPGFSADILDQFGDPYVSARREQRQGGRAGGLGLGVFIAKTLLERSGATLEPRNRPAPLQGAVVKITWPRGQFEQPVGERFA